MSIDNSIKKLYDLTVNKSEKYFSWLRQLLLMASSLLGILISLHLKPSEDNYTHALFSITLLLLGLGILSGSIALYADVYVSKRMARLMRESLQKQVLQNSEAFEPFVVTTPKIFSVCFCCLSGKMTDFVQCTTGRGN
ncbi:hypothetical protein [Daejeonella sp.]|uniref:hypothetical protein n=1 Tax=Daejeonella sp. TaxID=2805397 RepID=UPI002727BB69|nr:hypothetical protein [Daejeonella sp.]MDO8992092.1 hypothetical protein [Daejeonella sp.]MDP2413287.1 hypothetical protein [Daejeonella sp.]